MPVPIQNPRVAGVRSAGASVVALATGGVERYNGAHVVMPYGMALDTLPKVAAYLRSERRIAFNEQGIFRRYPELDIL